METELTVSRVRNLLKKYHAVYINNVRIIGVKAVGGVPQMRTIAGSSVTMPEKGIVKYSR